MYSFYDVVNNKFNCENLSIRESGNIFSMEFNSSILPDKDTLEEIITKVIDRDSLSLSITDYNDNICIIKAKENLSSENYLKLLDSYEENDTFEIKIEIYKNVVDGKFTIYDWDIFIKCLLECNEFKALSVFNNILKNSNFLCFEILDKEITFSTKTMCFSNNTDIIPTININRDKIISNRNDIVNFNGELELKLLPYDFIFDKNYSDNPLTSLFFKLNTILSMIYMSNSVSLTEEEINLSLIGQKNIKYNYKLADIKYNLTLQKIIEWLYSDDNIIDKAMIARNIITLHCKFSTLMNLDEKTLSSILSNYQIYLKDNVDKFLEAKEKVADFINDISLQVGENALNLLNSFKNNISAIFGFLLTVIIANLVSDKPLNNILTVDVIILLDCILIGSFFYYIISLFETMFKLEKNNLAYTNLKNNYKEIFSKEDFSIIFKDNMFNKCQKSVRLNMWIYSTIWIIGIFLMLYILNNVII